MTYTFDERSGAVTIGDKAGTLKDGKLTIDGNDYTPLFIPQAGKRYTFNEQKHTSFRGYCGLITGCTTTQEYLTMTPDGQFVLTRSTLSTIGDPGLGPYTAAGSWPPDQHGTYDVQAGGKIVLDVRRRQRARPRRSPRTPRTASPARRAKASSSARTTTTRTPSRTTEFQDSW